MLRGQIYSITYRFTNTCVSDRGSRLCKHNCFGDDGNGSKEQSLNSTLDSVVNIGSEEVYMCTSILQWEKGRHEGDQEILFALFKGLEGLFGAQAHCST